MVEDVILTIESIIESYNKTRLSLYFTSDSRVLEAFFRSFTSSQEQGKRNADRIIDERRRSTLEKTKADYEVSFGDRLKADSERKAQVEETRRSVQLNQIQTDITEERALDETYENQIKIEYAQNAFSLKFSETAELNDLWQRSAQGKTSFESARSEFWRLINNDDSHDAMVVRKILDLAGYELQGGGNAPLLKMEWEFSRNDPVGSKQNSDRKLSIDHKTPQSDPDSLILSSNNLAFLSSRDNSFRGNRYNAKDKLKADL
jgi:hypothetical protein